MAEFFTESEARELCELILAQSTADAAQVKLSSGSEGFTTVTGDQVSTSGEASVSTASVTSIVGGRVGCVRWNDFSLAGLQRAVARSEELATSAPQDPEAVPFLGPQDYVNSQAFFTTTADLGAADRADALLAVINSATAAGLVAAGFMQRAVRSAAVANSIGLFAYHDSTLAAFTTTARTPDGTGSGWAGTTHNDWLYMTAPNELAERAIDKARGSQGAEPVAPGTYTVVLEPTAVGNLVQLIQPALDARSVDEGRSFFSRPGGSNVVGEQVIDERLSLLSDPTDPDLLTCPFSDDGLPLVRTTWIEEGLLRSLAYSRYWAQRQGRDAVVAGGGIKLTGGDGTTADLIRSVERGLLVTRLRDVRAMDQSSSQYTGHTTGGTFLIEDGQIVRPVRNLRFIENPIVMLNKVEAIGSSVRVVATDSGDIGGPV
ncbi:MAG: TldD/PmbA family protein, partial [Gemmatimonadota bacterium]